MAGLSLSWLGNPLIYFDYLGLITEPTLRCLEIKIVRHIMNWGLGVECESPARTMAVVLPHFVMQTSLECWYNVGGVMRKSRVRRGQKKNTINGALKIPWIYSSIIYIWFYSDLCIRNEIRNPSKSMDPQPYKYLRWSLPESTLY